MKTPLKFDNLSEFPILWRSPMKPSRQLSYNLWLSSFIPLEFLGSSYQLSQSSLDLHPQWIIRDMLIHLNGLLACLSGGAFFYSLMGKLIFHEKS